LFDERDAADGVPKAEAARRKLAAINSTVDVRATVADFNFANAERLAGLEAHGAGEPRHQERTGLETGATREGPGVIVDGTDNFETRYLLNDLAIKHGVPYVYAGAVGTSGTGFVVLPGKGPCLRCLYPELPGAGTTATCDTAGVLGPLVGMVASWQAVEALKVLVGGSGDEGAVSRKLWTWEAWRGEVRGIDVAGARDAGCACCGDRVFQFLEGKGASRATALCGRHAVQLVPAGNGGVDLVSLAERLRSHGAVTVNEFLVRARLEGEASEFEDPVELTVFRDGRTVVRGTSRPEVARGVYAKYVGM
jgi:adenylyltransferase/sulfurtransferase